MISVKQPIYSPLAQPILLGDGFAHVVLLIALPPSFPDDPTNPSELLAYWNGDIAPDKLSLTDQVGKTHPPSGMSLKGRGWNFADGASSVHIGAYTPTVGDDNVLYEGFHYTNDSTQLYSNIFTGTTNAGTAQIVLRQDSTPNSLHFRLHSINGTQYKLDYSAHLDGLHYVQVYMVGLTVFFEVDGVVAESRLMDSEPAKDITGLVFGSNASHDGQFWPGFVWGIKLGTETFHAIEGDEATDGFVIGDQGTIGTVTTTDLDIFHHEFEDGNGTDLTQIGFTVSDGAVLDVGALIPASADDPNIDALGTPIGYKAPIKQNLQIVQTKALDLSLTDLIDFDDLFTIVSFEGTAEVTLTGQQLTVDTAGTFLNMVDSLGRVWRCGETSATATQVFSEDGLATGTITSANLSALRSGRIDGVEDRNVTRGASFGADIPDYTEYMIPVYPDYTPTGNTYYVRADGTATALVDAISSDDASTSINSTLVATLREGILPQDTVIFSNKGGDFGFSRLKAGGIDSNNRVTYRGEAGHNPFFRDGKVYVLAGYIDIIDFEGDNQVSADVFTFNSDQVDVTSPLIGIRTYNLKAYGSTNQGFQHEGINHAIDVTHYNIFCENCLDEGVSSHDNQSYTVNGGVVKGCKSGINWVDNPDITLNDVHISGVYGAGVPIDIPPSKEILGDVKINRCVLVDDPTLTGWRMELVTGAIHFTDCICTGLNGEYLLVLRPTADSCTFARNTCLSDVAYSGNQVVFNQATNSDYSENTFINPSDVGFSDPVGDEHIYDNNAILAFKVTGLTWYDKGNTWKLGTYRALPTPSMINADALQDLAGTGSYWFTAGVPNDKTWADLAADGVMNYNKQLYGCLIDSELWQYTNQLTSNQDTEVKDYSACWTTEYLVDGNGDYLVDGDGNYLVTITEV